MNYFGQNDFDQILMAHFTQDESAICFHYLSAVVSRIRGIKEYIGNLLIKYCGPFGENQVAFWVTPGAGKKSK